jgi:hypothetical protein
MKRSGIAEGSRCLVAPECKYGQMVPTDSGRLSLHRKHSVPAHTPFYHPDDRKEDSATRAHSQSSIC